MRQASWYINGIPLYCIDSDPLRPEWEDESLVEIVHYKGSDQSAVHVNGFGPERFETPVRVHESNHLTLKALRQTSVLFVRVSDDDQHTAVLVEYQARRQRGTCWYQGTVRLVDV